MTLPIYLKHLRKVHSKFFSVNTAEQGFADLDTKFFVRKLKNEVFSCHEVLSFERIIRGDVDLTRTFEG